MSILKPRLDTSDGPNNNFAQYVPFIVIPLVFILIVGTLVFLKIRQNRNLRKRFNQGLGHGVGGPPPPYSMKPTSGFSSESYHNRHLHHPHDAHSAHMIPGTPGYYGDPSCNQNNGFLGGSSGMDYSSNAGGGLSSSGDGGGMSSSGGGGGMSSSGGAS